MMEREINISTGDAPAEATDPFEGHEPVAGRESLGRVIRDAAGQLSGSPANYEGTRGVESASVVTPLTEEEETELLSWLTDQVPPKV
jgi:hypothetical protein